MSRSSSRFFPPQITYNSLTTASDSKEDDDQLDDEQTTLLIKDAAAFKITRDQLQAQKKLLQKANTIAAKINIQIQKLQHPLLRSRYAAEDAKSDIEDDNVHSPLIQNQAQALKHALLRKDKIAREIPRIETTLHQIQSNNFAAGEKFIEHYPWQFPITKKIYQSYVGVEIAFIPFTLKTVGLSVVSCAAAWNIPQPSPGVAFAAALPLALCDSAFSVLLYNSHISAVNDVFKFYEQHQLKSYQRVLYDSLLESVYTISFPVLALGAFNQLALKEHNLLGGAAIIIGMRDYWLFQAMGEWQLLFFIPMLIGAVGFYGATIDPKYNDGMHNNKAYNQVFNTFKKLFTHDFSRGFDVLYRGLFSNAFLRALTFYYLASEVRNMSRYLTWVDPVVAFLLVFHHSIASRYKGAYEPSFGKKEHELVQIFVDLKLKNALAAEMNLAYTHNTQLTIEGQKQQAMKRIRAKAEIEATEYLNYEIEELLELRTWKDFAIDLRGSVVIGSLRALFGYILMSTYGMALVESFDNDYLSEDTNRFIQVTSSLTVAMLFFGIYFNAYKQATLEAKAVICYTDDDIKDTDIIEEIIAAENAIEQTLVGNTAAEQKTQSSLTTSVDTTALMEMKPDKINTKYSMRTILNVGTGIAFTIAGGSWTIRLVSGVYQTIFPFIGMMDERDLVSLITLSLAEQGVLNLNIFFGDLEETIHSILISSKYIQNRETPNSATEVARTKPGFGFGRWAIFTSTSKNPQPTIANSVQLQPLQRNNNLTVLNNPVTPVLNNPVTPLLNNPVTPRLSRGLGHNN